MCPPFTLDWHGFRIIPRLPSIDKAANCVGVPSRAHCCYRSGSHMAADTLQSLTHRTSLRKQLRIAGSENGIGRTPAQSSSDDSSRTHSESLVA